MNIFLKNLDLKILAILASVMLWIFVVGIQNSVFLLADPLTVKVINLGDNVSIKNNLAQVKVRVKSEQQDINSINANDFEAIVDAKNLAAGEHSLIVSVTNKNPKAMVVAVEPLEIKLSLEGIITKEVDLKTELIGQPDANSTIEEIKLDVSKLKLTGPNSILQKISQAKARIILNGDEKSDMNLLITPEIEDGTNLKLDQIKFDPAQVKAKIKIIVKPPQDIIDAVTNGPTSGSDNNISEQNGSSLPRKSLMADVILDKDSLDLNTKEILPKNILVLVEGPQSILDQLTNKSIRVKLSKARIEKGGIFKIQNEDIVLPNKDLKVISFSPEKIQVKF